MTRSFASSRIAEITLGIWQQLERKLNRVFTSETATWFGTAASDDELSLLSQAATEIMLASKRAWNGPSFGIYAQQGWRSLMPGFDPLHPQDPGNAQIRYTPSGVDVRLRISCPDAGYFGHNPIICDTCWTMPKPYQAAEQWQQVGLSTRILIHAENHKNTRLVSIQHRTNSTEAALQITWSEPWSAKDAIGGGWTELVKGVQWDASPYLRGILVRRLTKLAPNETWSTPEFFTSKPGLWQDIAPGLQAHLWVKEGFDSFKVNFRQCVGYQMTLATEKYWGESIHVRSYGQTSYSHGRYAITQLKGTDGLRISAGYSDSWEIDYYDDWIQVLPDLRIRQAFPSGFTVQIGTDEPVIAPPRWSKPIRLTVERTDTYLTEDVLVRRDHNRSYNSVAYQRQSNGSWKYIGRYFRNSSHELTPGIRVTFTEQRTTDNGIDLVMEVQYANRPEPSGDWTDPATFDLTGDWGHVLPGLQLKWLNTGSNSAIHARTWLPYGSTAHAAIGSERRGAWSHTESSQPRNTWTEFAGGKFRFRRVPELAQTLQVQSRIE